MELENSLKSKILCGVCLEATGTQKSLLKCATCERFCCKLHYKAVAEFYFCDICIRAQILMDERALSMTHIRWLNEEIKSFSDRESASVKEMHIKSLRIKEMEEKLHEKHKRNATTIADLERKLEETVGDREKCEEIAAELTLNIEDCNRNVEEGIEIMSTKQIQCKRLQNLLISLEKDLEDLKTSINTLIIKRNSSIPYQRLRNTVCNKCHNLIKSDLRSTIIEILKLSNSDSLMDSLINKSTAPSARKDACGCIVQ